MSNKKFKGQISIYLLIGLLILLILIFLIFINSDEKQKNLEEGKSKIKPLNEETLLVKTRVDYCLTKELKKGLIIAGLKGGYIYDKGEYSFGGIIPKDTYTTQLISNLNLNWNTLQSQVIVYSNIIPTPTEVKNNTLIYEGKKVFNHTTTDDFEKFITSNFLKCLDFEDLKESYEFNYSDYYGNVINLNYPNNELIINNIDAKIGDKIKIDLENQDIIGEIIEENQLKDKKTYKVKFTNLAALQNEKITTLENLNVINLNTDFKLNIDFNYEDVILKVYFPINIKHNNSISTFEETTIKLDVRFKALLEFAKELIDTKYYIQKDIDYSNPDDVYKALNKSEYFKTTKLREFTLSQKTIKNEDEHKQFVYSIIDHNSKINGNPYVFNFAYENEAPIVDFKTINPDFMQDNQTTIITLIATKGDEIRYELRPHTKEKQIYDRQIFYFEPQEYSSNDAQFTLTKNGSMYFKPEKEKLYTYPIKVTDGETVREHIIIFITGFPDNTNNTAAKECFKFKNYEDLDKLFTISQDFKDKIFLYKDGEYENVFALTPYYLNNVVSYPNRTYESEIYFAKSCVYNTDMYSINAFKTDPSGKSSILSKDIEEDDKYFKLKVPMQIYPQTFTIEIMSNSEGTIMTEPFNITVYPSTCLGPDASQTGLNATCCNTEIIKNKINFATENSNPAYLDFITTSPLKNNEIIYNENVYACYSFRDVPTDDNNLFDYSKNNIWGVIKNDITSLFETNLEIKCQGKYPNPMQNINQISISGGSNYGKLTGVKINKQEENQVTNIQINLKKVSSAQICEFCSLDEQKGFSIISTYNNKKLIFNLGSKNTNQKEVFVMPQTEEYNNVFVLCDDSNWYGSNKQNPFANSDWEKISGIFGENDKANPIHISLGYCSGGTNTCTGKTNAPKSESKFDLQNECVDYYFNPNLGLPIKMKPNTGWSCATDKICNNGLCLED